MTFPAAADRPTFAVCNSITKCSLSYTVGTMCLEALPTHHRGTLDVARRLELVPLDVDQEVRHP